MTLTDRETATVLAALRLWQEQLIQDGTASLSPDHFGEGGTPLTVEEIDVLCERLNLGEGEDE